MQLERAWVAWQKLRAERDRAKDAGNVAELLVLEIAVRQAFVELRKAWRLALGLPPEQ